MRSLAQELVLGDTNHFQFEVTSEPLLPSFNQQKKGCPEHQFSARKQDCAASENFCNYIEITAMNWTFTTRN
jgi:hypothetical protein